MKQILFLSVTFLMSPMILAMDSISPAKNQIFFTNDVNDCGFIQVKASLAKTGPGDEILVSTFDLTDYDFIETLAKAKKRGVDVKLIICGTTCNATLKEKLDAHGLSYQVFNADKKMIDAHTHFPKKFHKKTIAWSYLNPDTDQTEYRVWKGSRNLSHLGKKKLGKEANHELMAYYKMIEQFEQAKSTFDHHWSMIDAGQKIEKSGNELLRETPKKIVTLNSDQYYINDSVAQRFEHANNKLFINWYNIDDQRVFESIRKASQQTKQMEILINETALNKESTRNFLQSLNIPIFVYNPDQTHKCGSYPVANHVKNFIRQQDNGDWLIGIGESNLTQEQNIGSLDLIPDNAENAQQCLQAFTIIKKESVPLKEALKAKGFHKILSKRKTESVDVRPAKRMLFSKKTDIDFINRMKTLVGTIQDSHKKNVLTAALIQQKKNELQVMLQEAQKDLSEKQHESVIKYSRGIAGTITFFENQYQNK